MENQHRKIKGYRELNQHEIDLMNDIKAQGPVLEEVLNRVITQATLEGDAESARWAAIAKTNLQQGLMALTRAVTKPDFF